MTLACPGCEILEENQASKEFKAVKVMTAVKAFKDVGVVQTVYA